jgi:predicted ATPase/DNA-binding CsgD family transcriptional regulator
MIEPQSTARTKGKTVVAQSPTDGWGSPPDEDRASFDRPLHTNLPRQFTSFVGRDRDLRGLRRVLATEQLVTLTGPGGIGKTRLAVEVARDALREYPDGAWFVDLAEVSRPEHVAAKFAAVLGQQEEVSTDLTHTLVERLRGAEALFVVDNCEHVLEPCAVLIAALIASCPALTLIATSRERLAVTGETIWQMAPLTVPDSDADAVSGTATDYTAVTLFLDRAAVVDDTVLGPEDTARVASICRRLDGLPLAIELAAARVNVLTVKQIAERLDERLALLVRGPRTSPARQQTLRATVEWSYELLLPAERTLFRRLAAFGSSFSLESAEEIGSSGEIGRAEVLELLANLVDKSLLTVEKDPSGARYRMLQIIREFASDALRRGGEDTEVRHRHAEHFAALARMAEPALEGAQEASWLDRLEREHDNLRDALAWCADGGDAEVGVLIAGSLWRFWFVRGYFAEGGRWLELMLQRSRTTGDRAARAKALRCLAVMLRVQGDYVAARTALDEALAVYRELDDRRGMAMTLNSMGILATATGEYDESLRLLGGEGLALNRELGDKRGIATCLNNMANATRAKGEHATTKSLCLESLALYREAGFREGEAASQLNLGLTAQATGDHDEAGERYHAALEIYLALGYREGVAEALEALGMLAGMGHRSARAARLLGAGERLRELVGAPIPFAHEKVEHDRVVDQVRSELGDEPFAVHWGIGRSLAMDEAVAYAVQDDRPQPGGHAPRPGGLTRRELEVTALVAAGFKDREVAERLHISHRTAGKHVEHIRDKLGLRSRSELGAWATRLGLAGTETTGEDEESTSFRR